MKYEPKYSESSIRKATGEGWEHWFGLLSQEGASELSHKNIVKLLETSIESSWWRQAIAVEYELAHGMRKPGQTADVGYEIGAQQMLPIPREELWDLLMSPRGLRIWLGSVEELKLEPGFSYRTREGTTGEVRSVKAGQRIRMTWKPKGRSKAAVLQLTLTCPRNTKDTTNLGIHQERLASGEEREEMRAQWKQVLEEISGAPLRHTRRSEGDGEGLG